MLLRNSRMCLLGLTKDLKHIFLELVQHKIELNTSIPPTHQTRYILNRNYATTIKQDINKLLTIPRFSSRSNLVCTLRGMDPHPM